MKRLLQVLTLSIYIVSVEAQERASCWLRDAAVPSDSAIYLLCDEGALLSTTDGGSTWALRPTGAASRLRAIAFRDARNGVAVGDDGLILATEDGGKSWEARKSGTSDILTSVCFVGNSGWATGHNGVIIHTGDGGRTWTKQNSGLTQTLESVFFIDDHNGWAVGWVGNIVRTTDGGEKWEQVKSPAAAWSLNSVYFQDAKNGWIVGFAGQILRSRDGGLTWEARPCPINAWLTSVLFDHAGHGWIAYEDGLLATQDGGETWKQITIADGLFLSRLFRVKDSLQALGPFGVLRKNGETTAWQTVDELLRAKKPS